MTDRDLLRAHIDLREVDRLGAFLGRYQESLVRFVANYLRDDTVARDIVQEMFRRVARHPKRLLEVTSCHNRLLSMARNLSVDHLRKKIRRRKHTGADTNQVARPRASTDAADIDVSRSEIRDRVRPEIDALSPRLRELMLLKIQERKSYREIAEITGLSVTNVGHLIHQAMGTLEFRLKGLRKTLESSS